MFQELLMRLLGHFRVVAYKKQQQKPLAEHLKDFKDSLVNKGTTVGSDYSYICLRNRLKSIRYAFHKFLYSNVRTFG